MEGKIQTLALEGTRASVGDVGTIALRHAIDHGILNLRSDIDKEIRERQESWRRRRGNEPPPPTSTGGNSPPSLPSGSTENDREPPPTHSIPEKPPETLSKLPPLLVESLNFFESGKEVPPKEERQYSTRFPQSTARFVNFELNVCNRLYRQRNQTHQMWVRLYDPNGGLLGEGQHDWVIEADCERTWMTWGWGNAEPGRHWSRGLYNVVVLIDGAEIAKGSFTITTSEEPPPTSSDTRKTPEVRARRRNSPRNSSVSKPRTGVSTPRTSEEKSSSTPLRPSPASASTTSMPAAAV